VTAVGAKRHHRLCSADALKLCDVDGDNVGQSFVAAHTHDDHEVPLPRHRIHLGHAVEPGEFLGQRCYARRFGKDQNETGEHARSLRC